MGNQKRQDKYEKDGLQFGISMRLFNMDGGPVWPVVIQADDRNIKMLSQVYALLACLWMRRSRRYGP